MNLREGSVEEYPRKPWKNTWKNLPVLPVRNTREVLYRMQEESLEEFRNDPVKIIKRTSEVFPEKKKTREKSLKEIREESIKVSREKYLKISLKESKWNRRRNLLMNFGTKTWESARRNLGRIAGDPFKNNWQNYGMKWNSRRIRRSLEEGILEKIPEGIPSEASELILIFYLFLK